MIRENCGVTGPGMITQKLFLFSTSSLHILSLHANILNPLSMLHPFLTVLVTVLCIYSILT
jgi:hypothetical protein